MPTDENLLAFDSGSPRLSLALSSAGKTFSVDEPQSRSSTQLPLLILDLMHQAGVTWSDLNGVIVARGPGSFTGLRVGMGFALGLHQSLGIPATAVSTLQLTAEGSSLDRPVTAAVNAWGDAWFIQPFTAPPRTPTDDAWKLEVDELSGVDGPLVTMEELNLEVDAAVAELSPAQAALQMVRDGRMDWDPSTLQHPLYLQAPPATLPTTPAGGRTTASPTVES